MGGYLCNTETVQAEMLASLGLETLDDLYAHLPAEVLLQKQLDIPAGKSELEISRQMKQLAAKNTVFPTVFRGAGAYRHYIPAVVKSVVSKERFLTAYTPYQAEISQGVLQSIFEFQTMMCELTGMDAANASIYDGASAAAEATTMCVERKRTRVYVSAAVHPDTLRTIQTYNYGANREVVVLPCENGHTSLDALDALAEDVACVYLQQPNFYGLVEDVSAFAEATHAAGAKLIVGCNPTSLGTLKTPAECGADIAVGEAQPLGMALNFGGPYLGFMACKTALVRRLPGRIVGETTDDAGNRAFVLTLQAREQHIRREKASSNVCSNQALCAMTATVYLAALGGRGFAEVSRQCHAKAVYAAEHLAQIAGFERTHEGAFFHEFVTECPVDTSLALQALAQEGILGGLPLEGNRILWCFTELNTKDEIDTLCGILRKVVAG